MTSRDRLLAAVTGNSVDRVPFTTWCFGLPAHPDLRWSIDGVPRTHWYSMRMEHLHTTAQPWTLEDDFRRVAAWRELGADDVLDVSVPWSAGPEVAWHDAVLPAGTADPVYPVIRRVYSTPAGPLRHAVRLTREDPGPGWPIQPQDNLPLIEDYNIPRAARHAVAVPGDIGALRHLYRGPDDHACRWFSERMATVSAFAQAEGVLVQAWAGFGMDAVVWFTGTEGAIWLALDDPIAFGALMEHITETDLARVELAAAHPAVDLVVARGWYSSTDLWSPTLFEEFVFPYVKALAGAAHARGKLFAYVMTTGVGILGPRLADAGVDVLYFVDPVQDRITLEDARDRLADRMTLVGGINATALSLPPARIRGDVRRALDVLGPTNRFILHPVDAVFPDTPWRGIEAVLEARGD